MNIKEINIELGNADLFLIDQILKNRFNNQMKILDIGCGEGRNLVYFIKNNFDVYGIDTNESAISMARFIAGTLNKNYNQEKLVTGKLDASIFANDFFDVVININVLHFSINREDFFSSFSNQYNMLKSNGILFVCMESCFGRTPDKEIKKDVYELKNGDIRFLLTEEIEQEIESRFKLEIVENKIDLVLNKNKGFSYRVYMKL